MDILSQHPHSISRRSVVQAGAAGLGAVITAGAIGLQVSARQKATPAGENPGDIADRVAQAVSSLETLIPEMMESTHIPGISVAVVYQDDVLMARGFGVCSTESNDAVDADTIFQMASLSKPIASTVVASIVGDGHVDWDSKIVEHLPGFMLNDPWITSQVTIRDMLTHRSGLPDHAGDDLEDMGYDRSEVLHRLRYQPLTSGFRATHAYTNFGFTAGAVAASNATEMSWEEASDARLYGPAGMTRTSSRFDDYINSENHARGHVLENGTWEPRYIRQPDPQSPAGGVSSTANDVAQWLRLHLGNGALEGVQVIPAETLAETYRPQSFSHPADNPTVDHTGLYALGWGVGYNSRGDVQLSHSGAFALGTGTTVYMLPAEGIGIAVLTNAQPIGLAEAIAFSFLDIVTKGEIENDYLAIFGPIMEEALAPEYGQSTDYSIPPSHPTAARNVDAYVGIYDNDYYGPIEISADGAGLTLSQGPLPNIYPLTHWDRDTFLYLPAGENANVQAAVTYTMGPNGDASHLRIENLDINGLGTFTRTTGAP